MVSSETDTAYRFSRRRLLGSASATAAAAASGAVVARAPHADAAAAAACASESSEQEVGPFYVAEGLVRSNIVAGEDGIPLSLTVTYLDTTTCEPATGLAVDIWQANAGGVYSDESSEGTSGETYLRGIQVTNSAGQVTFTTIMPGWYSGRTMHIHDRVYSGGTVSGTSYSYSGATLLYTGQYFFPADVDTAVAGTSPYSFNTTTRTTNSSDRVYTEQNGSDHVLTITGSTSAGYTGTLTLYVDTTGSSSSSSTSDEDFTALTITASETNLVAGEKLTLSGVLTDTTTSTPIGGAKVLVARTIGSIAGTTAVTTASDGAWTLSVTAYRNATYEATYAGDDDYQASSSGTLSTQVHFRVVVSEISSTASHSRAVHASGKLVPAVAHRPVVIVRVVDGVRHKITTVKTNSAGHWSAHWHMSAGKHVVRAVTAAHGDDLAGTSRAVVVRRT